MDSDRRRSRESSSYRSSLDRGATPRRRAFSLSARSSSSNSGPRYTLAEWAQSSLSNFGSLRTPSLGQETILRPPFPAQSVRNKNSKNTPPMVVTSYTVVDEPSGLPKEARHELPELLSSKPLPPPPIAQEEFHVDAIKKPRIKVFLSSMSSMLAPKRKAPRQPSEDPVDGKQTLFVADQGVTTNPVLSVIYDTETCRLTGLDWCTLFPGENRDPFAGVEIPDASLPSSGYGSYRLLKRVAQKIESLAQTAKSKLPTGITIQVRFAEVKARSEDGHAISAPFNVAHSIWGQGDGAFTDQYTSNTTDQRPFPTNRSEGHCTSPLDYVYDSHLDYDAISPPTDDVPTNRFPTRADRIRLSNNVAHTVTVKPRSRAQSISVQQAAHFRGGVQRDRTLSHQQAVPGSFKTSPGRVNMSSPLVSTPGRGNGPSKSRDADASPEQTSRIPLSPRPIPRNRPDSITQSTRRGPQPQRVDHASGDGHTTHRHGTYPIASPAAFNYHLFEDSAMRTPNARLPTYF